MEKCAFKHIKNKLAMHVYYNTAKSRERR